MELLKEENQEKLSASNLRNEHKHAEIIKYNKNLFKIL